MTRSRKHAFARHVHFYRHTRGFRAHDGEENVWPDCAFASERAANKWTNDANIFYFQTLSARDQALDAFHELRRVIQSEFVVAFPDRDRARHLDRVMRFGRS